jgi:hypothetical protein
MLVDLIDDPQGKSPYGRTGRDFGQLAIQAADALADEPGWDGSPERRWSEDDHEVFNRVMTFVDLTDNEHGDLCATGTGQPPARDEWSRSYENNVRDFHLALPFSEAERFWVADTVWRGSASMQRLGYPYGADAVRRRVAFDLIEAGRHKEVYGEACMDAFWAWRREVFEFQGAGSLDVAVDALRSIGQILLANVPDAVSYERPNMPQLKAIRGTRRARRQAESAIYAER